MPILTALYRHDGEHAELTPQQIEVDLYELKYKGSLFCTTAGCQARIVYVHQAATSRYFRTWKYDNHSDNCPHRFDRERTKIGVQTEEIIFVQASPGKKGKALDDAFRIAKQGGDGAGGAIRITRRPKISSAISRRVQTAQLQLALEGLDEQTVKRKGYRFPRLRKRAAQALRDTDLGTFRLVYGRVTGVDHETLRARIRLDGGLNTVHVRFEEAFFASNRSYQGLFHYAHRFCSEHHDVIFTGIGEVKLGRKGEYELFIYEDKDFKLQNTSLLSLAAFYEIGLADG